MEKQGTDPVIPAKIDHAPPVVQVTPVDDARHCTFDAGSLQTVQPVDRPVETPFHVPETIVDLRLRTINADPNAVKTCFSDPSGSGSVKKPTVCVHGDLQPARDRVGSDIIEVIKEKRFTSAEVDEDNPLFRKQVHHLPDIRWWEQHRFQLSAKTVRTCEIALVGKGPVDGEGRRKEIAIFHL